MREEGQGRTAVTLNNSIQKGYRVSGFGVGSSLVVVKSCIRHVLDYFSSWTGGFAPGYFEAHRLLKLNHLRINTFDLKSPLLEEKYHLIKLKISSLVTTLQSPFPTNLQKLDGIFPSALYLPQSVLFASLP